MAILYIIRGLPGSGKSTYAKSLDCLHVEADMYFQRNGEYDFNSEKLKLAHHWCEQTVFAAMRAGMDVCVSNTFVQHWQIQPYLDKAASTGHSVNMIAMRGQYGSTHNVPADILQKLEQEWQAVEGEQIL